MPSVGLSTSSRHWRRRHGVGVSRKIGRSETAVASIGFRFGAGALLGIWILASFWLAPSSAVRQGFAISADGTIVVGRSTGARGSEAFLWQAPAEEN